MAFGCQYRIGDDMVGDGDDLVGFHDAVESVMPDELANEYSAFWG